MNKHLFLNRAFFTRLGLLGVMVIVMSFLAGPVVQAQETKPDPTADVPEEVELPVDISIDIITDGEGAPPTEILIDVTNSKNENEVHLILPPTGGRPDVTPAVDAPPVDTPPVDLPVFDTPPVDLNTPVESFPPLDGPPVDTPPVTGPPVDRP